MQSWFAASARKERVLEVSERSQESRKRDRLLHARGVDKWMHGSLGDLLHPLAGRLHALAESAVDLAGQCAQAFDLVFQLADVVRRAS